MFSHFRRGGEQQASKRQAGQGLALIVALALLPALVKIVVQQVGLLGYLWQSLYKVAQLAGPVWWRRRFGGKGALAAFWPVDEPLPAATTWLAAVAIAALLAGAAIGGVLIVGPALAVDPKLLRAGLDERFDLTPLRAAAVVVYLLTINAALEELHFRAWLDRELAARLGNAVGIAGSAAAFAGMHVFIFAGLPAATPLVLSLVFASLFLAGATWSLLARRPGGIHAAWLSHGLTDAGLLTWGLFWLGYF